MSPDTLSAFAGVILSLAFEYIPGLRARYDRLTPERKRATMLAALVLAALIVAAVSCGGWGQYFGVSVPCDTPGMAGLLRALMLAAVANQTTHRLTKRGGGEEAK